MNDRNPAPAFNSYGTHSGRTKASYRAYPDAETLAQAVRVGRATIEVTTFDEAGLKTLLAKIAADSRVLSVTRLDES